MESISSRNLPLVLHTLNFEVDDDVVSEVISKELEPLKKQFYFSKNNYWTNNIKLRACK